MPASGANRRPRRGASPVLEELNAPGPFLALSHGDAESNNILARESGPADARLIDFEAAGYAHALIDAVCLHVPGPGWISVGDPGAAGLAGSVPPRSGPGRA
jgi:aminoglycoside phosphotransferase (APT) family kinase protein